MTLWDDNDHPLAYLITFRTYGTWLHGDERGSIDRYHNQYRGPRVAPNPILEGQHRTKLKSQPVLLDEAQRPVVKQAIKEVCTHRAWRLYALNVRTNHAHVVVNTISAKLEFALRDFKSYSTRALRSANLWPFDHSPWVDGGSTRYLWKEHSVSAACDYVLYGQGDDLPDF
jgi:REP element-mobilizing transposase RayT